MKKKIILFSLISIILIGITLIIFANYPKWKYKNVKFIDLIEVTVNSNPSSIQFRDSNDYEVIQRIFLEHADEAESAEEAAEYLLKRNDVFYSVHFIGKFTDLRFNLWFVDSISVAFFQYERKVPGINLYKISESDTIILKDMLSELINK